MSESTAASASKFYFTCTALITLCSMALFFMLLSWAIGGDDYKDRLLGNYAIPVLVLGVAVGMALKVICRRREQAKP